MSVKPTRTTKAATLIALTILLLLVLNLMFSAFVGKWSLLLAFGVATLLMWPIMHKFLKKTVYGKIFYKIDSKKGLNFIDKLGTRYSRFWTFLADLALIISFGGLGTAFVANHREKRARSIIIAAFAFLVLFVYLSHSFIMFFPFGLVISQSLFALLIAAVMAYVAYGLSYYLSKGQATIVAFLLAVAFFSSPFILDYLVINSPTSLMLGLSLGIIGLPAMIIMPLLIQGINIVTGISSAPGLNPGYPEMENGMPVLKYAGTNISIPIFPDILIAFIIMIALHECFHGLVARAQGIRLKHTGLLFMSIIPMGAFVEPDEKQFQKEKMHKQLRVYAAGSFANMFVVALILFLVGNSAVSLGMVKPEGFIVGNTYANSSADGVFLPGDVVTMVNGTRTQTFLDFSKVMSGKKPGDNITIVAKDRTVSVTLGKNPDNESRGFVGIVKYTDPMLSGPLVLSWDGNTLMEPGGMGFAANLDGSSLEPSFGEAVFRILKWVFFLNLMLGIMNLLPLRFFDGGFAYMGLFIWLEKKLPFGKRMQLARSFSAGFMLLVLAVFVLNLSPYLF